MSGPLNSKSTVLSPTPKFATVIIYIKGALTVAVYHPTTDGNNALKQEKRDVSTGDIRFWSTFLRADQFRVIEDQNGNGKWDADDLSTSPRGRSP